MKKAILVLLLLIVIIAVMFVTRIWVFDPKSDGDTGSDRNPASGQTNGQDDDEAERLKREEEQREAEQREAEQREAERLAEQQAAEQREAELIERREYVIEESRLLFRGYFYEEAISLLNADEEVVNEETRALEQEILSERNNLVLFEGDIKHIFFHSLIIYPESADLFPGVPTASGYNSGFIFQSEFNRVLPQLLERGYVLYKITDLFSKDANGVMRQNDIYLPPGKKPLILSIDDPTLHYGQRWISGGSGRTGSFDRNRNPRAGFANRVIFDEFGELATEVVNPQGELIVTYDGDVQLILDSFVREHPEFSFRGHKGVIAATGFMGIFGYDLSDLRDETTRQVVISIVEKMKENGWLFASHSYSHNRSGFWGPDSSAGNIRWDTRRWKEEMEPIVGQTNIFIAPFGFLLRGDAMQVIIDNGFDIYCTVDLQQPITIHPTHAVQGRVEIGGYAMARWADTLNRDFFDVDYVIAPYRPPLIG